MQQQNNCWARSFLCGPCPSKGKLAISCSQNFLSAVWGSCGSKLLATEFFRNTVTINLFVLPRFETVTTQKLPEYAHSLAVCAITVTLYYSGTYIHMRRLNWTLHTGRQNNKRRWRLAPPSRWLLLCWQGHGNCTKGWWNERDADHSP
jgi:hypothetical protein